MRNVAGVEVMARALRLIYL